MRLILLTNLRLLMTLIRVFTSKNWGFAPNPSGRFAAAQGLRPWTPDRLSESLPGSSVYTRYVLAGGPHVPV